MSLPWSDFLPVRHASSVKYALGIGFGRRIQRIDRLEEAEKNLRAHGTTADGGTFVLDLDPDYIVRSATITVPYNARSSTLYIIHTSGLFKNKDLSLAENGEFKKKTLIYQDGTPTELLKMSLNVNFLKYKPNLSDAEYQQLTELTAPPVTRVNDHILRAQYTLAEGTLPDLNEPFLDDDQDMSGAPSQTPTAKKIASPSYGPAPEGAQKDNAGARRTGRIPIGVMLLTVVSVLLIGYGTIRKLRR